MGDVWLNPRVLTKSTAIQFWGRRINWRRFDWTQSGGKYTYLQFWNIYFSKIKYLTSRMRFLYLFFSFLKLRMQDFTQYEWILGIPKLETFEKGPKNQRFRRVQIQGAPKLEDICTLWVRLETRARYDAIRWKLVQTF